MKRKIMVELLKSEKTKTKLKLKKKMQMEPPPLSKLENSALSLMWVRFSSLQSPSNNWF
jgi:hypothetical protein